MNDYVSKRKAYEKAMEQLARTKPHAEARLWAIRWSAFVNQSTSKRAVWLMWVEQNTQIPWCNELVGEAVALKLGA